MMLDAFRRELKMHLFQCYLRWTLGHLLSTSAVGTVIREYCAIYNCQAELNWTDSGLVHWRNWDGLLQISMQLPVKWLDDMSLLGHTFWSQFDDDDWHVICRWVMTALVRVVLCWCFNENCIVISLCRLQIFPAVLRALKNKETRLGLVEELSYHIKSNRAVLDHQQFNMVVKLINCALQVHFVHSRYTWFTPGTLCPLQVHLVQLWPLPDELMSGREICFLDHHSPLISSRMGSAGHNKPRPMARWRANLTTWL